MRIGTIDVDGDPHDFPVAGSCAGTSLAPRATCAVVLRFSPLAHAARNGSLSIYDVGAGTAESTSYGLAGFGTAPRTWAPTSRMVVPRVGHTATLLPDGRVLVVGGDDENLTLASESCMILTSASGPPPARCRRPASITLPRSCRTARYWSPVAVRKHSTPVAVPGPRPAPSSMTRGLGGGPGPAA